MTSAHRSMGWMVAFVAMWAVVEAIAADLHGRYSPWQVVWTRYAVHLVLMVVVFGWRKPALWRTPRPLFQLARSLLMVAMPAAAVFGLSGGLDADTLMAGFWIAPLLILALALALLHERVPVLAWIFCGVAFIGTSLATLHGHLPALQQLAYPVTMALSFSLYVVMTRSLRAEPTRVNLFYTALGVFLVLTPAMPHLWVRPDRHDVDVLLAIGAAGFVALYALDRFAHAAPVSIGAPLAALQLPIGLAIAAFEGHPILRPGALAGLVLVGIVAAAAWLLAPRLVSRDRE